MIIKNVCRYTESVEYSLTNESDYYRFDIGKRPRSNLRRKRNFPYLSLVFTRCLTLDNRDLILSPKFHVMMQCKMCQKYFHQKYENILQSAMKCKKVPWFCSLCSWFAKDQAHSSNSECIVLKFFKWYYFV